MNNLASILSALCGTALFAWAASWVIRYGFKPRENKPETIPLPLDREFRCEVCDEIATAYRPILERSMLDKDPFGHKRLHGLTPMYIIGVQSDHPRLCAAHERLIRGWNEEALAEGRALTARHNAMLEQRYARLANELLVKAQVQAKNDEAAVQVIREQNLEPMKALPARDHGTVTLLQSVSDEKEEVG